MTMKNTVFEIMNRASPAWGVCAFGKVGDCLLQCSALKRLPRSSRSVITALFPYYLGASSYQGLNVSKYAAVADYHSVVSDRLSQACDELGRAFPEHEFVAFADNSPVPEVKAAYLSGLGRLGRNGLVINPVFGSYVFIGEIVTSLALEAGEPMGDCPGCGKCIDACPCGALNGGFDSGLCLSAVTQKKGELTADEQQLIKHSGCAWGCDVCQDVCPLNRNVCATPIEEFLSSFRPTVTEHTDIAGRAYEWRGKATIMRNISILDK